MFFCQWKFHTKPWEKSRNCFHFNTFEKTKTSSSLPSPAPPVNMCIFWNCAWQSELLLLSRNLFFPCFVLNGSPTVSDHLLSSRTEWARRCTMCDVENNIWQWLHWCWRDWEVSQTFVLIFALVRHRTNCWALAVTDTVAFMLWSCTLCDAENNIGQWLHWRWRDWEVSNTFGLLFASATFHANW